MDSAPDEEWLADNLEHRLRECRQDRPPEAVGIDADAVKKPMLSDNRWDLVS